ncbi:hypothetical protein J6590_077481 [Homalodisca vitripennis]|nr:hypothetical protein J6590_077481 [Homalodisca vitripennis]
MQLTVNKATKAVAAPGNRRLLMSLVQSVLVLLCGAKAHVLEKHFFLSRVATGYRTVSEPSVMVITGVCLIFHLAMESQVICHRKTEVNRDAATKKERNRSFDLSVCEKAFLTFSPALENIS